MSQINLSKYLHWRLAAVGEFLKALTYEGKARYVAVFWGAGDEAYYTDGMITAMGYWPAYLAYVEHPHNAQMIMRLEMMKPGASLGHSDDEATHCLMIDRDTSTGCLIPLAAADEFLKAQWPPMPELTPEQIEKFLEHFGQAIEQSREIDMQELNAAINERLRQNGINLAALERALNQDYRERN